MNTLFAAWPRAVWTRTGYSAPAPGQVTRLGPILNSPYHGRLFFAGEHTSTAFFGHMEGALQSGMLAALRILREEGVPSAFAEV
jgi:monoamine oxidase